MCISDVSSSGDSVGSENETFEEDLSISDSVEPVEIVVDSENLTSGDDFSDSEADTNSNESTSDDFRDDDQDSSSAYDLSSDSNSVSDTDDSSDNVITDDSEDPVIVVISPGSFRSNPFFDWVFRRNFRNPGYDLGFGRHFRNPGYDSGFGRNFGNFGFGSGFGRNFRNPGFDWDFVPEISFPEYDEIDSYYGYEIPEDSTAEVTESSEPKIEADSSNGEIASTSSTEIILN